MLVFAGKNRVASGAIFLSLAFCHVTTMAAISLDAASSSSGKALYSTGSGSSGAEDLCGTTVPRTGCPADRMVPRTTGMSRLLEKRSAGEPDVVGVSSSADDSGEEEEVEDTSGGSPANRPSGTTGNRKLWNVPFRMPYGGDEEKRKFMFGKRRRDFSAPEQDKIRKRSGGKEKSTRKFKFGKRPTEVEEDTGTGSELDDNPETGYDGRLDAAAAMTSPGSQIPDLDRSEGSSSGSGGKRIKRKFKFGKKSGEENSFQEDEEEEEEDEEEEMEEEKRKIMFGKRQDYTGYGTLVDDDGRSVESKRRAKFQFGKRRNHHVYPYEIFPKLKTKFKLGK